MNNAELYEANNQVQRRDAKDCLDEYSNRIKWKNNGARVLDIGSGDGSVTVKLLKQYIPDNFERLHGCDISESMVAFANLHYMDERTDFSVLDIERLLPDNMRNSFDHVFSFYALHWIKNQEAAFCNVYDMLTEGGQCLLAFLGQNSVFDVYRELSQSKKWSTWLRGVERFISPYQDSKDPEKEITKIMNDAGFKDITVTCKEKLFVYDSTESMKKAVDAVNPFNMPKPVFNEFMDDYIRVVKGMKLIDEVNNNEPAPVKSYYKLIIAYGTK